MYTQAEHLRHWFAPKGVTLANGTMDFREGGTFLYSQELANGDALWGLWQFQVIQKPEKITLLQHFSDPQGGVTRNPWNSSWPLQTLSTTTFTAQSAGTLLSISWQPMQASAAEQAVFAEGHASMSQGWGSVLDRLEEYLSLF
jgi:uncharacterized protein YndB with AHSA1/START domain